MLPLSWLTGRAAAVCACCHSSTEGQRLQGAARSSSTNWPAVSSGGHRTALPSDRSCSMLDMVLVNASADSVQGTRAAAISSEAALVIISCDQSSVLYFAQPCRRRLRGVTHMYRLALSCQSQSASLCFPVTVFSDQPDQPLVII